MNKEKEALLKIKNLHVQYNTEEGIVKAVNGLSMVVKKGQTLGLVGETGAGKTTVALSILKLVPDPPGEITAGEIFLNGDNLLVKSEKEMRAIRGNRISMIFQDPMTALNPLITIGDQVAEAIQLHEPVTVKEARERAKEILELVGISRERFYEYPHQFSGGMKQRVVIAIALSSKPELLIADEPTTALDVTIQAQILEMIKNLKQELDMSMIMITHDLGIVAQTCDHVVVIYAGEFVEMGTTRQIFKSPTHPYTIGLLNSLPNLEDAATLSLNERRLKPIAGLTPDPTDLPCGCKFYPRCSCKSEKCVEDQPVELSSIGEGHMVRCILAEAQRKKNVT